MISNEPFHEHILNTLTTEFRNQYNKLIGNLRAWSIDRYM